MEKKFPLNFCFSSLGCPQLSLGEILSLAAQWQLGAVELRAAGGHIDIVRALTESYQTPERMAAALSASSVRIASFSASLRLLTPLEAERAEVLALAHWADALGVRWIRVFDGQPQYGACEAAQINSMLSTLGWWHTQKRQHHFQCELMIETHGVLADPLRCIKLASESTAPIHLLWDSFHTWQASSLSVSEVWQMLHPYVRHVHFKDAKADPSAEGAVHYCLPGEGNFPLQELFTCLCAASFTGWVSLEWERMWHPHLPALEKALAAGRAQQWW